MRSEHDAKARRFDLYEDDGSRVGEIEYRNGTHQRIYAVRTVVYPPYRGKGYARVLLDTLADFARERGVRIVPKCSYVEDAFARDAQRYGDVIAPSEQP